MDERQIKAEIKQYLIELCAIPEDVDPSENLFESGILSSSDMIDLILFIEERFGISIDPQEISLENLNSLNRIADSLMTTAAGVIKQS